MPTDPTHGPQLALMRTAPALRDACRSHSYTTDSGERRCVRALFCRPANSQTDASEAIVVDHRVGTLNGALLVQDAASEHAQRLPMSEARAIARVYADDAEACGEPQVRTRAGRAVLGRALKASRKPDRAPKRGTPATPAPGAAPDLHQPPLAA